MPERITLIKIDPHAADPPIAFPWGWAPMRHATEAERVVKIENETEDVMTTIEKILKLDRALAGMSGEISKTVHEKISKTTAGELLEEYATALKAQTSGLTKEAAYAKAMEDCPVLGAVAIGHSLEMARGGN